MLGRDFARSSFVIEVARQRRGLDRERLRRPRLLAGRGGLRHRALLDAEDRLAGDAIEDEQQPHLRDLRDRRDRLAVLHDVDQRRRGAQIVVPDVVVHELPVPLQLAGRRVERDDGVPYRLSPCGRRRSSRWSGIELGRKTMPRWASSVRNPQTLVPPGDSSSCRLPRSRGPARRARRQVERPEQLAGPGVPGADPGACSPG